MMWCIIISMTSNTKPKVSIVCTNYNKGEWIKEAMDSFLKQKTDFPFEIIMIDDKSTDGSDKIIKEYAKKYPEIVRAHFNTKNLGITKTWIKVCKFAKGEYIARCDGDDYWINNEKLQMQVDALRENKKSKWCSTDYDIYNVDSGKIEKNIFENEKVNRTKNFSEMLAKSGWTMASSWLVEAELMININNTLDVNAEDDTFNIQLDLFNKTTLTYVPVSTVVYRVNEGSDSRPEDAKRQIERQKNMLKTQFDYAKKYQDKINLSVVKELIKMSFYNEMLSFERLNIVKQKDELIREQDEIIREKDKIINNILNSKKYRAISKLVEILKKLKIR